ncbi:cytochrome P450 [Streptomyces sp. NPDC091219]|uniref:cytochrome P450 n=1 Tax=Streptomyces sp. NPDC091219 TaxID=3155193 RepID=UPI00344D49E0
MFDRPRLAPGDLPRTDLADPRVHAEYDLSDVWRHLRSEEPVYWQPETAGRPGFWVVTRYDDVAAVYKNKDAFTSERGNVLDTLLAGGDSAAGKMLAVTDGPDHSALRTVLNKPFGPRALEIVVESVRRSTWRLLAEAVERGTCDFAGEVAAHIPLAAICDLLGVPTADRGHIIELTSSALSSTDGVPTTETSWTSRNGLLLYFAELAESRRSKPYDDIVSLLVSQEVAGRPLSHEEIIFNCYSIIMGGHETTRLAMIGGLEALIAHPRQWELLKSGAVGTVTAVDEVLRWTTPALHGGRTATQDSFLGDAFIEEGDVVTVWNVSANHDERVFDHPERFDQARTPNKHLAFAHGAHFCIGAHLARQEISAVLEALRALVRTPVATAPPQRVFSSFLSGLATLPVALEPERRPVPGPAAG